MKDTYSVISILGGIQGILLSLIFFIRKGAHPAARFLGWYLLVFSLGLFETYFQQFNGSKFGSAVSGLLGFSNFLYGPLLYLFIRELAYVSAQKKYVLHFLPFIIGFAANLFCIFIYDPFAGQDNSVIEFLLFELLMIQILIYNFKAIRLLSKYRPVILQTYSSIENKDLSWLRYFLLTITGIYILSFFITHVLVLGYKPANTWYVLVQLSITISIYLMSYKMFFQPGLFSLKQTEMIMSDTKIPSRYAKSSINSEQLKTYTDELTRYLRKEKPYRDADLNVYLLAEQLGMTKNNLTQVINEGTGKTFYELINYYRVEEVKQLILNGELGRLTISAIGAKAGFKSKSAFHTNFKKQAGCTPIEWKKQQEDSRSITWGVSSQE